MDCGAACLAMLCRHYGINMTLGKLRELANVTTQGATLDSLARAGESLGFGTRGVQCTFDALLGFELPFIVHWEGYHYVVVYGVSPQPGVGGRPGGRLQEDERRGIRARLERHLPGVHARPAAGAAGRGALAVAALRRLPAALQEDPAAPVPRHLRDPDARHRAADDHPEHPRRRGGAPERQPAAPADPRAGHLHRVQPGRCRPCAPTWPTTWCATSTSR